MTAPSPSSSPRAGKPRRRRSAEQVPHGDKRERMQRLVELVQRRAAERAQRFVGREIEVLVEGPSRTDPARLRGRTRHNKAVNFEGHGGGRARWSRCRDHRRRPRRPCSGSRRCSPGSPEGPGDIRADRGRQDRRRGRAGRDAARAGRGSGRDLLRRAAGLSGLETLTGVGERRAAMRLEHRLIGFVPVTEPFSVGDYMRAAHREVDAALAGGRRPIVVGGTGPLPARGARRALAGQGGPREFRIRALVRPRPATRPRSSASTWIARLLYERIDARTEAIVAAGGRRRCAAPRPPVPRARRARRSASRSCSAATWSR